MQQQGIMLFNSSMIAGSNISTAVNWPGGRSAIVVSAIAYAASGLQLQTQAPSSVNIIGSSVVSKTGGNWIVVGSAFIGDQVFVFDSVPGNYRLVNQSTSSVIGINAALVTIPNF